jgi:HK97 gp10 family phage protein
MGVGVGIMAKMKINAGEAYSLKLSEFGKDAPEIAKKVVMAGANPIADEIRKNLIDNLRDPSYAGKGDKDYKQNAFTGDLLDSFGIAPPGTDKNGNTNTKIGFAGYDRKGVPNALKARAMESGTSQLRKRPFVRPAVNKMRGKAIEEMSSKLDEEMKIYAL